MADVFISYSKSHVELTRELAKELEAKGLTVWWDTDLLAGESFRHRIIQEIKACKAAIVIWTRESVHSDYVLSEAERARVAGKLIQLRTADLDPSELPPPFDTSHASLTEDRKAIYGALAKLGVLRNDSTVVSGPLPRFREDSRRALWTPSVGKLVAAALATLMVIGALATAILFRADRPPPIRDMEGRAAMVANQFFDELNAGLPDSSHFNADVRLGRRGLMSRADAVGELRKLSDKYHKINCRMDGNSLTLKTPEFAQSGFRAKVYADCDFTDKSDVVTTRRFPLEIEAAAGPHGTLLISGLWQSEEMVLWQPAR